MTFDEYQKHSFDTAVYPDKGHNVVYPALGLAGETGEVCEKIKKALRDDGGLISDARLNALALELGDVLWYVSALARELGLSLENVARLHIDKLASRKARGQLTGSGDLR